MMTKSSKILIGCTFLLLVFGIFLWLNVRHSASINTWKSYKNDQISFRYPSSWTTAFCNPEGSTFLLPGTTMGMQGDDNEHHLALAGFAWAECRNNTLHFSPSDAPGENCSADDYTIQWLKNGLYLDRQKNKDNVIEQITVEKAPCAKDPLFIFSFYDAAQDSRGYTIENLVKSEITGVNESQFAGSQAYIEIVKFAENIKLNN